MSYNDAGTFSLVESYGVPLGLIPPDQICGMREKSWSWDTTFLEKKIWKNEGEKIWIKTKHLRREGKNS